jgi:chromosome segregation ATPase
LAVVVLAGAVLAGCASGNCTGDPRTDNVWCADKALTSGAYAQDLKAKESTLAAIQKKAAAERLTGQQLRARLADLRARRQRMERELTALLARVTRLRQQGRSQNARFTGLQADIAKALEEQRAARTRLEEAVRRVASGKAATGARAGAEETTLLLEEEAAALSDEQGIRLFAQQVDEVTRT